MQIYIVEFCNKMPTIVKSIVSQLIKSGEVVLTNNENFCSLFCMRLYRGDMCQACSKALLFCVGVFFKLFRRAQYLSQNVNYSFLENLSIV